MSVRSQKLGLSSGLLLLAVACGSDEKEQVRDPDNRLPEDQIRCSCRGCFFCNGPNVNDPNCPVADRVPVGDPASGFPGASCLLPPAAGSCTQGDTAMQDSCEQTCLTDNQIIAACSIIELSAPACTALGCPGGTSSSSSPLMAAQPGDSVASFDAALSRVNVSNGDESGDAAASGRVHVQLCSVRPCTIVLHYFEITSEDIDLDDTTLKSIRAIGHGPIEAIWSPDGSFTVSTGGNMVANFNVDGDAAGSMEALPFGLITGTLDPTAGSIAIDGVWRGPPESLYEELTFAAQFRGTFENRAPIASAGADRTIECTEPGLGRLNLDGTASNDPEGNLRLIWVEGTAKLAEGLTPEVGLSLGGHTLRAVADDHAGAIDEDSVDIEVVDTSGPGLTVTAAFVDLCEPGVQQVQLPLPSVTDACAPSGITLEGAIVAVNGEPVAPIALVDGSANLSVGTLRVRWSATDVHGNASVLEQTLEVRERPSLACCKPGQSQRQGTDYPDLFRLVIPGPRCVLAAGGADAVSTLQGSDYIAGGSGSDLLESFDVGSSSDVLLGNAGNDILRAHGPFVSVRAFGGAGNDIIEAGTSGASVLYGNSGDDLIRGQFGDEEIVPGPGRDTVSAGAGDDTVRIYDVCEFAAGEVLNGGLGHDTLITPVPLSELFAFGVLAIGFEAVQVDATKPYLAECFGAP